MREENEKIMDGGFIMGRDEERTVELVVESIIVEDNPKSFDAQVKAFYNTYVDVKVIGYDTQLMGRVVLQITTLMGTKINNKSILKKSRTKLKSNIFGGTKMMNSSIIINSLCKQSLESFQLPEMVRLDSYIPAANHLRAI